MHMPLAGFQPSLSPSTETQTQTQNSCSSTASHPNKEASTETLTEGIRVKKVGIGFTSSSLTLPKAVSCSGPQSQALSVHSKFRIG